MFGLIARLKRVEPLSEAVFGPLHFNKFGFVYHHIRYYPIVGAFVCLLCQQLSKFSVDVLGNMIGRNPLFLNESQ